jgi:hypothetical protein
MFKKHSINRVTLAALAAGVSVALVGPAQAGSSAPVHPDDRADRTFPAAEQSWPILPDDRADRTIAPAEQSVPFDRIYFGPGTQLIDPPVRPDDRADRKRPSATSDGGMVTGENKRDVRLGVNYEPTLVASTPQPHRLDWGDAGIGAGGMFGLVVLAALLTVAGLRYRRPAVS